MQQYVNETTKKKETLPETLVLTPKIIEEFLGYMRQKGRTENTLSTYSSNIKSFYHFLPIDKQIEKDTLVVWKNKLVEDGFSAVSINNKVSTINSLLSFLKRRDLQDLDFLEVTAKESDEITRPEYIHLLQTARAMGEEKLYLLIKIFAIMGLPIQELQKMTVEAIGEGHITVICRGSEQALRIPEVLCNELLAFAKKRNIQSGPIFVRRTGKPIDRNHIGDEMKALGRAANIPEKKINPRSFQKLYQQTMNDIRADIDRLIENAYDHILIEEQKTIGWENCHEEAEYPFE